MIRVLLGGMGPMGGRNGYDGMMGGGGRRHGHRSRRDILEGDILEGPTKSTHTRFVPT